MQCARLERLRMGGEKGGQVGGKEGEGCAWCVGVNEGSVWWKKGAGIGRQREKEREGVILVSALLITVCLIER